MTSLDTGFTGMRPLQQQLETQEMTFTLRSHMAYHPAVAAGLLFLISSGRAAEPGEGLSSRPQSIDWTVSSFKIPFDLTLDKPAIMVRINGAGPFYFKVDTGVLGMTVDDEIVLQAGLKPVAEVDEKSAKGATGGSRKIVHVDTLNFGGVIMKDLQVAVVELDGLRYSYRRYDGTIGLSVFADCLVTLDYPKLSFRITQGELPPVDGQKIIAYKDKKGLAAIPLAFEDFTVDAIIDSGSVDALVLDESAKKKVKMAIAGKSDAGQRGHKSALDGPRVDGQIALGGYKLIDPPVRFHKGPASLGQLALYRFAITLDQRNQRVSMQRSRTNFITFESPSVFGMALERWGRKLRVVQVIPGMPACRAGLIVGDGILALNRQYPLDFDEAGLRDVLGRSGRLVLSVEREGLQLLYSLRAD